MTGVKKVLTITLLIFVAAVTVLALLNTYQTVSLGFSSVIGSNSNGYVTKEVYAYSPWHKVKIAVVTGMHPRETVSKTVIPSVIKSYALKHNVELVNYQVNVTNDPEDFKVGRSNGESLVAQYVIPDVKKSGCDLVIICHDHEAGYGKGFYIATPTMDSKSLALGESVASLMSNNSTSDFNYYKRSVDSEPKSTSIKGVDLPITSAGIPVFVYETPETSGNDEAGAMAYKLLDASFNVLNAQ